MSFTRGRLDRLVRRGLAGEGDLAAVEKEAAAGGRTPEELLLERGVPRHEILLALVEHHGCPALEGAEDVSGVAPGRHGLDLGECRAGRWVPLGVSGERAEVLAYQPGPEVAAQVKARLGVREVDFRVGLDADVAEVIANTFDLNPGFPPAAGRTPLARVRTFLAQRRTELAERRARLAKGRTGLAFLRTGIACVAIAVTLHRAFGPGPMMLFEAVLLVVGAVAVVDGARWYIPASRRAARAIGYEPPAAPAGVSVLQVEGPAGEERFSRSAAVPGAAALRAAWSGLTPVQRRRFLAADRTDLAEERTTLADLRTGMAQARTGLALTRSGVAFAGLGIALLRQFPAGAWNLFDAGLILGGVVLGGAGLRSYALGRHAGNAGRALVRAAEEGPCVWDEAFPTHVRGGAAAPPPVLPGHAPGIWATTGLALERTVLAERRNAMARLRTIMARARTAMSFVRTGLSITSIGAGLLIYFGAGNRAWTAFDLLLAASGLLLVADGVVWYLPADRIRRCLPYCFGDIEIPFPDYAVPAREWRKVAFSHDDL